MTIIPRSRPTIAEESPWSVPHRRFHKSTSSRPSSAWPWGLLGMLLLVGVIEAGISRDPLRFLDPPAYSWVFSAERARNEAVRAEVLCLGDSLVKHGLVPSLIASKTNEVTENVSAAAAPATWTYYVLLRAIEAGSKPRAIVFDLKPAMLAGGPRFHLRRYQELLSLRECWELYRTSKSSSVGVALALGRLPSVRRRLEIREAILSALDGKASKTFLRNQICLRNWTVNDGANVARKHPEFQGEVSEAAHQDLLSDRFIAHKVNIQYAHDIVNLARSHSIASYIVLAPNCRAIQQRRNDSGAEGKYEAFARSLQEIDPRLTVVDARDSDYPDSVFVDPTHLDRDGAVALSEDLAEVLNHDREVGSQEVKRWVKLPKYHERPLNPALEDIEDSRSFLKIRLE